jgi:hypothetical protein
VAAASGSEDAIAALLESAKSGGAKFEKVTPVDAHYVLSISGLGRNKCRPWLKQLRLKR